MKSALILSLVLVGTLAAVEGVEVESKFFGGFFDGRGHGGHGFSDSDENGFFEHHGHGGHGFGGPHGNSQSNAGKQPGCSNDVEARNKAVALGFINEVLGDKNVPALDKYVAKEEYIQHNPDVGDGLEAVKTAMKVWFKDAPKEKMDVRRISCECDLCWAHIKTVSDDGSGAPVAQVDIFRMCPQYQGKICEHWDVIQKIPPPSANSHPMF